MTNRAETTEMSHEEMERVQGGGYDGLGRLTSDPPPTSSSSTHTFTVAIMNDSGTGVVL